MDVSVFFFPIIPTEEAKGKEAHANGQSGKLTNNEGRGSRQVKGVSLIIKQFMALLIKRFHHATRSSKDFLAQVNATGADLPACVNDNKE